MTKLGSSSGDKSSSFGILSAKSESSFSNFVPCFRSVSTTFSSSSRCSLTSFIKVDKLSSQGSSLCPAFRNAELIAAASC
eukprot:Skav235386  [mRNA]  locus=scaffold1262:115253:128085:+ [translate_table: standard]